MRHVDQKLITNDRVAANHVKREKAAAAYMARLAREDSRKAADACIRAHKIVFDGECWWTRLGGITNSVDVLRALRVDRYTYTGDNDEYLDKHQDQ